MDHKTFDLSDFLNSVVGGFIYLVLSLFGSYWIARFVWRRVTATPGFFRTILGALAWVVVFAVCALFALYVLDTLTDPSDFRKKTRAAFKALETGLENERRDLSAAKSSVRSRIQSVRDYLGKIN